MDNEIEELVNKLFEQKSKLIWLTQQVGNNDEQKKVIEEAAVLLEKVDNLLRDFGYGLPT